MSEKVVVSCTHDWQIESRRRNGTWAPAPDFPLRWAVERPRFVRATCRRCGVPYSSSQPKEKGP